MIRPKDTPSQKRPEFSSPVNFPEQLPISSYQQEIQNSILKNQVIIVVGETGSGKTTQLPKMCLNLGRGRSGVIVHTQPRRLAAKGIAQRLREELKSPDAIGLKVRFDDNTSRQNYIQVMTDGLVLNSFVQDPLLRWCDTLIIDEAHERSLNIDFLLGLVKQLLIKRPEFRLIVTSATIQHQLYSQFFSAAPVFTVSGRTYPVSLEYLGPDAWGSHHGDPKVSAVIEAVMQIYGNSAKCARGDSAGQACDTLVFLPGERQIHDTAQALRRVFRERFDILPLYARLASSDQSKVFNPGAKVRIVLSTNLAETSITVPRIGYVIDSGLVRMSRYSQRRKVQLLPIEAISKASAAQRAGRCGRIAPGFCFRLYSEDDFFSRPEYPEAEIHRTHLAGVILQMKAMRLGEPARFPFIEAPASKMINDGYQLLEELHAVEQRRLTTIGREMARLPLDPRIARLIIGAEESLYEALIIASAMSVMDVLDIPREAKEKGQQLHGAFQSKKSDFISLVLLWHRLEWYRRKFTRKEFQSFCEKYFISIPRFYEWRDVHRQLKLIVTQGRSVDTKKNAQPKTKWSQYLFEGLDNSNVDQPYVDWDKNLSPACSAQIHQPVIAAFATQVAMPDPESGGYISCRQRQCFIHPSSKVKTNKSRDLKSKEKSAKNKKSSKSASQWIVVGEFLETQKLWARQVACVDVEWILPNVQHLVKYTYAEPAWSKKMGAVVAFRTTLLFGLPLKRKEKVLYSDIDFNVCREIFIQSAFVEQQLGESRFDHSLTHFVDENSTIIAQVEELEAKARTSGMMANDQDVYDFFTEVIPDDIIDRRSFFSWWKKYRTQHPRALTFSLNWFLKGDQVLEDHPSALNIGHHEYQLEYSFDPGQKHDGVTIIVPHARLYDVNPAILEWLVPGLCREKCETLIRGLPKVDRKRFVPIPQFVDGFLSAGYEVTEPLTLCIENFLQKTTGYKSIGLEWPTLDNHLCMKIRLIDGNGNTIDEHYELESIRSRQQKQVSPMAPEARGRHQAAHQQSTTITASVQVPVIRLSGLPDMLKATTNAGVQEYSTLSEPDSKGVLHVFLTPDAIQAEQMLYRGVVYLLRSQTSELVKKIKRDTLKQPLLRKMLCRLDPARSETDQEKSDLFWDHFMVGCFESVFDMEQLPVTAEQGKLFYSQRSELVPFVEKALKQVMKVAQNFQDIQSRIEHVKPQGQNGMAKAVVKEDILKQYTVLLSRDWLALPCRYPLLTWATLVEGLAHRLEKLSQRGSKDDADAARVMQLQGRLDSLENRLALKSMVLIREHACLSWAIQALRVALFAQQLKLSPKVSLKRISTDLEKFEIALRKS